MSIKPELEMTEVVKLWLHRQGLAAVDNNNKLTKRTFQRHLTQTGALQIDSVNVVDRAHYLTLWSRFGNYDRSRVDRWVYRDKIAYEYWGHEASLLPISNLPLGRRRMKRFPPARWKSSSWWERYQTTASSKRRVIKRLTEMGPLESVDFQKRANEQSSHEPGIWNSTLEKEDKRSLQLLWHAGRTAISGRRHFRKIFDLAERIYPESDIATPTEYEDSWLLQGLSGNGIASEAHLTNYLTSPNLKAGQQAKVIARNLKQKRIVEVSVRGFARPFYALPKHLDLLGRLDPPVGTTLICPFDSLLWQRKRAKELMDFHYRVEIYVPERKRQFGYYVLPILHNGKLVGRLDPKFDRAKNTLRINSIHLEENFRAGKSFNKALSVKLNSLAEFLNASEIQLPKDWSKI